jgi:hypothetical protein
MVVEEDRLDLPDPLPLDLHVLFARRPLRRLPGLREHRSVATSRCLHFAEKPRSITPIVIRSLVLLLAAAAVEAILDLAYKAQARFPTAPPSTTPPASAIEGDRVSATAPAQTSDAPATPTT